MSKWIGGLLAVAVMMAGALALAPEADAGYRLGFVSYKIVPSVVDGWTMDADADTDAAEKAAAKALRFERLAACGAHLLDQNNDGTPTAVGASSCDGAGGQHIRYNGDSRANHPGSAGSAWPSDTRGDDEQSSFSAWQDCDTATYSQGDGTNSADLFCVIDSGVGAGQLRFVNDAARTAYHSR